MRFSPRSKVSILLSAITILTLVSALMVTLVSRGTASHGASASPTTASYQGVPIKAHVLATNRNFLSSRSSAIANAQAKDPRYIPFRSPGKQNGSSPNVQARIAGAPQVKSSSLFSTEGTLAANFDGVSDHLNKLIDGFHDTPPDQGLCVGFLGGNKVVIEVVNSIFGIFTTGGTLLTAFNVTDGFNDPNAFTDPRCFYDTSTNSFYMTEVSCFFCGPPGTADSVDDVLVVNRSGAATTYQFDTSVGGTCFGDQPHTGYDSHALYVATDEFCNAGYEGALLIAISKSQLADQVASPNALSFPLLSLGGVPILTLEPAFGNASGTEYLLNSFPFDQFGHRNSIANTLGFWSVHGDANITTGSGTVTLNGQIIDSETYAFPVPAASTGTGAVNKSGITSEAFLNPDDSRMLQVQLVKDPLRGLQLYAALDTAVTIPGDPSARDGAAWFVLNPNLASITRQGYVAVAGAYLLYPAILHTPNGTTAMAFTITSPTLNPSAAYVVRKSLSFAFGPVLTVATGSAPHVSFSDFFFGRPRWGDYSAEELDPNGQDIWSATEYIGPPPGGTDTVDNWGTRVWDVTGSHFPFSI
jgi:hypothetical protein